MLSTFWAILTSPFRSAPPLERGDCQNEGHVIHYVPGCDPESTFCDCGAVTLDEFRALPVDTSWDKEA